MVQSPTILPDGRWATQRSSSPTKAASGEPQVLQVPVWLSSALVRSSCRRVLTTFSAWLAACSLLSAFSSCWIVSFGSSKSPVVSRCGFQVFALLSLGHHDVLHSVNGVPSAWPPNCFYAKLTCCSLYCFSLHGLVPVCDLLGFLFSFLKVVLYQKKA